MPKLFIIVGIGGSGKTMLGRTIAERQNGLAFSDGTLTNSDRRRAGFECLGEIVARLLRDKRDCVMDESHLTVSSFRKDFSEFCDNFLNGIEQEWIFFEHDFLGCVNNIFHDFENGRDGLDRLEAVSKQSEIYNLPEPGSFPGYQNPLPVFRRLNPQFNNIQDARDWLNEEIARKKNRSTNAAESGSLGESNP